MSTGRTITLTEEGEWWIARDEDAGITSQGWMRTEAIENGDEPLPGGRAGGPVRRAGTRPRGRERRADHAAVGTNRSRRRIDGGRPDHLLRPGGRQSPHQSRLQTDEPIGSHLTVGKPVEGEGYRRVTISIHPGETIPEGTLREIADDAGAKDFEEFCRWIDRSS